MAQQHTTATTEDPFEKYANSIEIEGLDDDSQGPTEVPADDSGPTDIPPVETDEAPEAEAEVPAEGEAPPAPEAQAAPMEPAPEVKAPEPSNAELERLKAQNEAHQRQLEQYRQEQDRAQLDRFEAETRTFYENQGVPVEAAQQFARQLRQANEQSVHTQRAQEIAVQNERGRFNAALHFAGKYGVDAQTLYKYDTPEAMEEKAKDLQRIANLEREVAEIKKTKVPAGQTFDNGRSAGVPRDDQAFWEERYAAGDRSERAVAAGRRAAGM